MVATTLRILGRVRWLVRSIGHVAFQTRIEAIQMQKSTKKKIAGAAVVLTIFVIVAFYLRTQMRIDSCLDNGGRWNYEKSECER